MAAGALAGSGGAALGTGAFTSVQAERSVSISVADDDRAFLRLEPLVDEGVNGEPTRRSFTNGQTVGFDLPGNGSGENSEAEGVGLESVYEFHGLLEVFNNGTQPVKLDSTYDGGNLADLALVNEDSVLRDDPPTLTVGESLEVGLYIDTHGSDVDEFNETLTITAERVGGNQD